MIHINRLHIRLPAHLHKDANHFATLLAGELARMPVTREIRADYISVPKILISPGTDLKSVVSKIASHVHKTIEGGRF